MPCDAFIFEDWVRYWFRSEGKILLVILGKIQCFSAGRNALQRIIAKAPTGDVFLKQAFFAAYDLQTVYADAVRTVAAGARHLFSKQHKRFLPSAFLLLYIKSLFISTLFS